MIFQIRYHHRLNLDDYFLLIACFSLTTGIVLAYVMVESLYLTQELNLNPALLFSALSELKDLNGRVATYQNVAYACSSLLWTTIFAVKFAYLVFFRQLVDRVKPLVIYWRVILFTTIFAYLICITLIYASCLKRGSEAGQYRTSNSFQAAR